MSEGRFGRFTIEGELGAGGMGRVFRAHDPTLRRSVAIKVLRDAGPEAGRALIAEARAVSTLNHPNICTIYEAGEVDGTPYIAMELVEGEPLSSVLNRGRLAPEDVVRYAARIATALAHAHAHGIVHGDLKGDNIVVAAGALKLLDFGLARRLEPISFESITRTSHAVHRMAGTVPYMAPELLKGAVATPAADVWAFGVLLYEMMAGTRPFSGQTPFDLANAILTLPPPPLPDAAPAALSAVVARCLQKDPALRYSSAREVLAVLEALGATPARPATREGARARPARLAAGILAVVAAAAAIGYALWTGSGDPPARAAIGSLAVLPFDNLSRNADEDYFADGMTDALITDLSRLPGLKVISRTSSSRYRSSGKSPREISRELGVEAIVDGAVLRAGDEVRISVRLVDAGQDVNLWADDYTGRVENMLTLQAGVARAIAAEIRAAFLPADQARFDAARAVRPEVLEEYLKGRHQWNRRSPESLLQAVAHFRKALTLDPDYAPAHAGLAQAFVVLPAFPISVVAPAEALPQVRTAAHRAIALDDRLAEAHAALAYERLIAVDRAASEREFRKALDIEPGNATARFWYAASLASAGRFGEALAEARRAEALDPVSPIIASGTAWVLHLAREFEQEREKAREVLALDPNFLMGHYRLGEAALAQERLSEAIASFEKARELSDNSPDLVAMLAHAYGRDGRRREARELLQSLMTLRQSNERYVSAYSLALIFTGLGDRDQAFAWLDRAVEEHAWGVAFLPVEASFDALRTDPRFAALTARLQAPR